MGKINKSNLGYLGEDFQYKLISAFIDDSGFFRDFYSIIDPNMFTETYLRTIVGVMKDYYYRRESVPNYETILILLREKAHNEEDVQYFEESINKLKKTSSAGREEIEDLAEKFFRQQDMIRASNELRQIAGEGDLDKFDECQAIIERLINTRRQEDNVSSPLQSVDDDLSKESIVTIPTGISQLDEALGGGLDKGKMGIIIGSMGFGKTSMTTAFAANAATYKCEANNFEGFKVLQIVFEDTHRDIHRKYFAKISGVESRFLNRDEETTNSVKEMLETSEESEFIDSNIKIVRYPSGELTATDIKGKIKKFINEGFKPDLVIVDYFGCLAPERGTTKEDITTRESATMRKFENMAPDLDIALWIPVQGNRESITAEIITNDKISGSIAKSQIAQVVISIARSQDDMANNIATLSLLKNRGGLGALTLKGIVFNNGTCDIHSEDAIDFSSPAEYNAFVTSKEKEIQKNMIQEARKPYKLSSGNIPNEDIPF